MLHGDLDDLPADTASAPRVVRPPSIPNRGARSGSPTRTLPHTVRHSTSVPSYAPPPTPEDEDADRSLTDLPVNTGGASSSLEPSQNGSQRQILCEASPFSKQHSREEKEALEEPNDVSVVIHSLHRSSRQGSLAVEDALSHVGELTADGKIQVRVTHDGQSTIEELAPYELAKLYSQQQAAIKKMQGEFDFLSVPDWVRLHPMLGAYLAEAFGTFAWVLTLSLASIRNYSIFNKADDTNVSCLPIGFMFTSMVFTFGYISGGHFNPAISIAVFLIRKMELAQCFGFILCQLAASLGAGLAAMVIQGNTDIYVPSVSNSYISSGIFSEMIYTFAIAMVVLNIGYSRQSGNFFYGFAIGMTMAAGSASVGKISGGAFNPAAATGLQVAMCLAGDCDAVKSFWIYWLAPVAGAVLASVIYSQMAQPQMTQVLEDHKVFADQSNNTTGQNIAITKDRSYRKTTGLSQRNNGHDVEIVEGKGRASEE